MGICLLGQQLSSQQRAGQLATDFLLALLSAPNAEAFGSFCRFALQKRGVTDLIFTGITESLAVCFSTRGFLQSHRFVAARYFQGAKRRLERQSEESALQLTENEVLTGMTILLGEGLWAINSSPAREPLILAASRVFARLGRQSQQKSALFSLVDLQPHNLDYCILLAKQALKFDDTSGVMARIDRSLRSIPHLTSDDVSSIKQDNSLRKRKSQLLLLKGRLLHKEDQDNENSLKPFKEALEADLFRVEPFSSYLAFLTSNAFRQSSGPIKWLFSSLLLTLRFQRFIECLRELPYVFYYLRMERPSRDIIRQMQQRLMRNELRGELKKACLLALRKVQLCLDCRQSVKYSEMIIEEFPQHRQEERLRYARLLFRRGNYARSKEILLTVKSKNNSWQLNDEIDIKIALINVIQIKDKYAQQYLHREKTRLAMYFTKNFQQTAYPQQKPLRLFHNFMNFMQLLQMLEPQEFIEFYNNTSIINQLPFPLALHMKLLKIASIYIRTKLRIKDEIEDYWQVIKEEYEKYRDYEFELFRLTSLYYQVLQSFSNIRRRNYSDFIYKENYRYNFELQKNDHYERVISCMSIHYRIQW